MFILFFKHVALRGHVANQILYISCGNRLMATKHSKVATYCGGLLPINSHNPLNLWPHEVMQQIRNISPL